MLNSTYLSKAPFLTLALLCGCSASGTAAPGASNYDETGGAENVGGAANTDGGMTGNGSVAGGNVSATGGSQATGGRNAATGGSSATGGSKATGGAAPTGGSKATGGSTANSSSTGNWTTGYVATMYGDVNSGDCVAYRTGTGSSQLFGDQTPIATYTCGTNNQRSGERKVTLDNYQSGVANNSSYYAAIGDLSSLWTVNGNAQQCTCNGSTSATCGGPSCDSEISSNGSCGVCIAVKCDPDSTYKDSSGYSHNSSCNASTYVVVQNMDACPHNHTTNVGSSSGWCTSAQAQHIDLSCSGLGDISTLGIDVGKVGWLGVAVQVVDCSVGLGKHSL